MPQTGQTYRLKDLLGRDAHLFMVISDTVNFPDEVIIVKMIGCKEGQEYDESCVLRPGDHPQIYKKSIIEYNSFDIYTQEEIARFQELIRLYDDLHPEVLAEVRRGAKESRHATRRLRDTLIQQGL